MNHKVLYIVGNGFDLHHHIKSSYSDFGHYVKSADPELYDTVEKYFSFGGNWSNLEEALGLFDADWLLEDSSMFLAPDSSDDEWSDASHHDYQYEVEKVVTALSKTLKRRFTTWVTTLQIPSSRSFIGTLLNLERNSLYLTFNYTRTLQRLYGVPPQNVLHIHNEAMSEESDLVLGHARDPSGTMSRNNIADLEDQNVRITEANEIIDRYFSDTYKPTKEIIAKHSSFFGNLKAAEQINVMGHSLSEVDSPYLTEIANCIDRGRVRWVISYYGESSIPALEGAMTNLGIRASLTSFIPMCHF
jgi:hypothetical protein